MSVGHSGTTITLLAPMRSCNVYVTALREEARVAGQKPQCRSEDTQTPHRPCNLKLLALCEALTHLHPVTKDTGAPHGKFSHWIKQQRASYFLCCASLCRVDSSRNLLECGYRQRWQAQMQSITSADSTRPHISSHIPIRCSFSPDFLGLAVKLWSNSICSPPLHIGSSRRRLL